MKQKLKWENLKNSDKHINLYQFILDADFSEILEMINDGYGYDDDYYIDILNEYKIPINFKLKVRFTKSEVEKSIILNFDSYRITIYGNKNHSKISNQSPNPKGYYDYKIGHISDSHTTITKRVFEAILKDTSLNNSIDVKLISDEKDTFQSAFELILDLVDNQLGKDEEWLELADKDKKDLFFKAILLHMQINTAIYSILSKYLENSYHFGPVRQEPKYRYKLTKKNEFDNDEYHSLLNQIPKENESFNDIYEEIISFIKKAKLGEAIFSETDNGMGKLKLRLNEETTIDLADAPSGLIQVFPFLLKIATRRSLWSDDNFERISIEQPELHLHPKLQTKLIGFLFGENGEDKYDHLLIETHSEHIIRKLQVMFAKCEIKDDEVIINYFENENGTTKVKKMEMEDDGFFKEPWPNGFFDESFELTKQLIQVGRN